jgi:predicted MFS family arabinose efflux permease
MDRPAALEAAPLASAAYRAYALGLLLSVYVLNFIDRQILTILAGPIAAELRFSDTQLGFLTGPAFALFYTSAGIPIARWADVGVRRSIIALALFVWSSMTALSGLAQSLTHIALARLGVGIGEAGGSPPAHSLISDMFPPERRASALSIYALGVPFGGALGTLLGGWIGELYGWRTAFLAVGLPGIALALLVRTTLREPPRTHAPNRQSMSDALRFMLKRRAFVHMASGAALLAFAGYGTGAFTPLFLGRVHQLELGTIATWLGTIALLGGGLGTYLGGAIADRLGAADVRWYLRMPAIASLLGLPFACLFYLWPDPREALLLSIGSYVLGIMYLGPTFAMTQGLVRPDARALAAAILLFIINAVGLGLGPWFVGALSDALEPRFGVASVGWASLVTAVVATVWASAHYALGARTLREDLAAKELVAPTP